MLRLSPIPAEKNFAVTFVDDTDLSTRENTEPVYEMLSRRNILGAKTVWVHPEKRNSAYRKDCEMPISGPSASGSTLDDTEYLHFVRNLADRGYEIALHGVTAGNSYRNETIEGLERYKEYFGKYPRINVFHEKNMENLYCGRHKLDLWPLKFLEWLSHKSDYQGHIEGSPYFWGDIAIKTIDYMRLPFHTIQEVNTLRINPSMPFHDPMRPYVNGWFASSDGADCQRFNRLLSRENVDKLIAERGACIVYTHFAKGFARYKGSVWILSDDFQKTLEYLTSREGGWYPTASELLDRLRDFQSIRMVHEGGEIVLINEGPETVRDIAIHAKPGTIITSVQGIRYEAGKEGIIKIGSIAPEQKLRFLCHQRIIIENTNVPRNNNLRRERHIIELLNYMGMLKSRA